MAAKRPLSFALPRSADRGKRGGVEGERGFAYAVLAGVESANAQRGTALPAACRPSARDARACGPSGGRAGRLRRDGRKRGFVLARPSRTSLFGERRGAGSRRAPSAAPRLPETGWASRGRGRGVRVAPKVCSRREEARRGAGRPCFDETRIRRCCGERGEQPVVCCTSRCLQFGWAFEFAAFLQAPAGARAAP